MEKEYQLAGLSGSFNAGKEGGKILTEILSLGSGIGGVGKMTASTFTKNMTRIVGQTAGYPAKKIVFNGIPLHDNLPPPIAAYGYTPSIISGKTEAARMAHINGFHGEVRLANELAATERIVVKWGDSTGKHGSDIISVNLRTGDVELWDSKYRSNSTTGKISPTFDNTRTRVSAIEEAKREIRASTLLSPEIRQKALENLKSRNFTTYTVGSGKVKTSVIQKYCHNQKCP
ncbi:hypothetical protein ACUHGC_06180 [Testudinibacter sp. P27/CKL/0425]